MIAGLFFSSRQSQLKRAPQQIDTQNPRGVCSTKRLHQATDLKREISKPVKESTSTLVKPALGCTAKHGGRNRAELFSD
jgi:hypothetical protein